MDRLLRDGYMEVIKLETIVFHISFALSLPAPVCAFSLGRSGNTFCVFLLLISYAVNYMSTVRLYSYWSKCIVMHLSPSQLRNLFGGSNPALSCHTNTNIHQNNRRKKAIINKDIKRIWYVFCSIAGTYECQRVIKHCVANGT